MRLSAKPKGKRVENRKLFSRYEPRRAKNSSTGSSMRAPPAITGKYSGIERPLFPVAVRWMENDGIQFFSFFTTIRAISFRSAQMCSGKRNRGRVPRVTIRLTKPEIISVESMAARIRNNRLFAELNAARPTSTQASENRSPMRVICCRMPRSKAFWNSGPNRHYDYQDTDKGNVPSRSSDKSRLGKVLPQQIAERGLKVRETKFETGPFPHLRQNALAGKQRRRHSPKSSFRANSGTGKIAGRCNAAASFCVNSALVTGFGAVPFRAPCTAGFSNACIISPTMSSR